MKKVQVIGAGQLGSRHLQALRAVKEPLKIQVIDPSQESLKVASERYEATQAGATHSIEFLNEIPKATEPAELAIVASNSSHRRQILEKLFTASSARKLILEKILFTEPGDYEVAGRILREAKAQAFVNCSMRQMPIYQRIRDEVRGEKVFCHVTGSQYGLITNAIHYADFVAWLAGSTDFEVSTALLDPKAIPSKRKGYLELNGTLSVNFASGTQGAFTCLSTGTLPAIVEVSTPTRRFLVRESERKAWTASEASKWQWSEIEAVIPFQSQLTTEVATRLLSGQDCPLTPYEDSARIHLSLFEPLKAFVRQHGLDATASYPFT